MEILATNPCFPLPSRDSFRTWAQEWLSAAPSPSCSVSEASDAIKGRILVTKRDFSKGEIIFAERPMLKVFPYSKEEIEWNVKDLDLADINCFGEQKLKERYPVIFGNEKDYKKARINLYDEVLTTLINHYTELEENTRTFLDSLYVPDADTYHKYSPFVAELDNEVLDDILEEKYPEESDLILRERIRRAVLALSVNGFESGGKSLAVFKRLCLCSHSCARNAVWSWSRELDAMILVAIEPLKSGQEIEISYLADDDLICPADIRRDTLRAYYSFDCCCKKCKKELDDISTTSDSMEKCINCGEITTPFPMPSALFEDSQNCDLDEKSRTGYNIKFIPACGYCCSPLPPVESKRAFLSAMWLNILEHPSWITDGRKGFDMPTILHKLSSLSDEEEIPFLSSCFRELEALAIFNDAIQHQKEYDNDKIKHCGKLASKLMNEAIHILINIYGNEVIYQIESSHLVPLMFMLEMSDDDKTAAKACGLIWKVLTETGVASEVVLEMLQERSSRWNESPLAPARPFTKRPSSLSICAEMIRSIDFTSMLIE